METEDGYVVAGITTSTHNARRGILLIKTDLEEEALWRNTFTGASSLLFHISLHRSHKGSKVLGSRDILFWQ